MTSDDLDRAVLRIGLRLSTHEPIGLSWEDWAAQLERRLLHVQSYVADGLRPSHDVALFLAAEAVALLVDVDKAEAFDMAAGEAA
jgi:NOL1/NOP2/fmu family ribosome biogenesis protein